LSTCLMWPCCTAVAYTTIVFTWPAGMQISVGTVILGHPYCKILECHT
jgi:hypothetical protein